MKILIFSSVCKSLEIFQLASRSYLNLNREDFEIDFLFFDDNTDPRTRIYLEELVEGNEQVSLLDFSISSETEYRDHNWDSLKIDRIISIKNKAIQVALQKKYDYLLLVDSDLVLHQDTLVNLVAAKKDFVFSIFWTKFREDSPYTPNAWDYHSWNYYAAESYYRLKPPGIFEVGGGGACTLLSHEILAKGLNFNRLSSINFPGEDRHFCTRAQALGYGIFVDSRLPCYHLFKDYMVPEATQWYEGGAPREFFDQWLDDSWLQEVEKRFKSDDSPKEKVSKFFYDIKKSFRNNFLS